MSIISTKTIETPIGDLIACAVDDGICLLEFHDRRMLPLQLERVKQLLKAEIMEYNHPLFSQLEKELDEYFHRGRQSFDVPIIYPGSPFQVKVWESLLKIPYGKVRSYHYQSELLGNPKAIRAMAKANGDNRLAIIIPCHRIIGSNGEMVGYGGKVWRKKYLLELEGALVKQGSLF